MSYNYNEETRWAGCTTLVVGLALVLVMIVGALAFGLINPTLLNMQREATQNSPQYVESARRDLNDKHGQYLRLETEKSKYEANSQTVSDINSQQKQILIQMHDTAASIPSDAVPGPIRDFLKEHPRA